jgi:protoporphyrinogen oxidase
MGKNAYETLFGEMFRKKFGKYAGNILASFIWSRIHMRTKLLGYMEGGFQTMIDYVAKKCTERNISIQKSSRITNITRTAHNTFDLVVESGGQPETQNFDVVISTLPSPILFSVAQNILSAEELSKLQDLKYLSATNLILEMEEKIFEKEYWVSLCTPTIQSLVFVQHTNFVQKSHYNNHNLLYIASYCEENDARMRMSKEDQIEMYLPTLRKLLGREPKIYNSFVWKARFAQPIFSKEFLHNVPKFTTSADNFYIANLDMTYPFDRGTNYAVKLGKDVATLVLRGMKM